MLAPSIYTGTFTTARTVRLGFCPTEGEGALIRAVEIAPSVACAKVAGSHWVMRFGLIVEGSFRALDEVGLTDGCPATGRRYPFKSPLRIPAGGRPAIQAFPYGTPPPLQHVSVTLEPAILRGR